MYDNWLVPWDLESKAINRADAFSVATLAEYHRCIILRASKGWTPVADYQMKAGAMMVGYATFGKISIFT